MKAVKALYEDGRVFFPFHAPEFEGPLAVLVIFPGEEPEEDTQTQESPPQGANSAEAGGTLRVAKIPWPGDCLRRNSPI